jgi:hypothetical protein
MAKKSKKDLSSKVMKRIEKEEVKMRPKIYFVLGSILLAVGLVGLVLASMFLVHLTAFHLRVHEPIGFLRFGGLGVRPFMSLFPWIPLVLSIGSVIGGVELLRRYDISYRKSFVVLVVVLILMVLVGGIALDRVRIGEKFAADKRLRPIYTRGFVGEDWVVGEVAEVNDGGLLIETPEGREVEVEWDEKTRFPSDQEFEKGEFVKAVGEWEGKVFAAQGIIRADVQQRMMKDFPKHMYDRGGKIRGKMFR